MTNPLEQITDVEIVDINDARKVFEFVTEESTGDNMVDSATAYFGKTYLDHLRLKQKYRADHHPLLEYLSLTEAQEMADLYQRMFERTIEARRVLEEKYSEDIGLWLGSSNQVRQAYKTVLTDKLSRSDYYRDMYFEGEEDDFLSDCHHTIQWLEGWLRSDSTT